MCNDIKKIINKDFYTLAAINTLKSLFYGTWKIIILPGPVQREAARKCGAFATPNSGCANNIAHKKMCESEREPGTRFPKLYAKDEKKNELFARLPFISFMWVRRGEEVVEQATTKKHMKQTRGKITVGVLSARLLKWMNEWLHCSHTFI